MHTIAKHIITTINMLQHTQTTCNTTQIIARTITTVMTCDNTCTAQHITLHVQQLTNKVIQTTMHSECSNETPKLPSVTEQLNQHFTGNDAITAENQSATSGEGDRETARYTMAYKHRNTGAEKETGDRRNTHKCYKLIHRELGYD